MAEAGNKAFDFVDRIVNPPGGEKEAQKLLDDYVDKQNRMAQTGIYKSILQDAIFDEAEQANTLSTFDRDRSVESAVDNLVHGTTMVAQAAASQNRNNNNNASTTGGGSTSSTPGVQGNISTPVTTADAALRQAEAEKQAQQIVTVNDARERIDATMHYNNPSWIFFE